MSALIFEIVGLLSKKVAPLSMMHSVNPMSDQAMIDEFLEAADTHYHPSDLIEHNLFIAANGIEVTKALTTHLLIIILRKNFKK